MTDPRAGAPSQRIPKGAGTQPASELRQGSPKASHRQSRIPVPDRLRVLAAGDRRKPVQQPAVQVPLERWSARLAEYEDVLLAVPSPLDRTTVRDFASNCSDDPSGAIATFIATQIWGYGTTGYGPFRLAEALAYRELPAVLQAARVCLRRRQPLDAFRVLCVEHRVPWTGTAFGTKFLYFADPHGRALILDSVVAGWLATHAGLRLRGQRHEQDYATWLRAAEQWARELGVPTDRLEMIIFSDGLHEGSSWKPTSTEMAVPRDQVREPMTCAEAIAQAISARGRPMRAAEIADEINRRGLYERGDGRPLPSYQVSSIAHANPRRFRIVDGLIAVSAEQPAEVVADAPDSGEVSVKPACVLIGCVSRKEPTARAAKDLYRTELFSRRRAYAEASGRPWLIVSAQYGLLDPDRVIEPYDVKISDLDLTRRQTLARRIADQLEQRFGALDDATFEVHAGDEYMQMLAAGVSPRGAHLVNPLRGLRIGEQLVWYGRRLRRAKAPPDIARTPTVRGDTKIPMRHPGLANQMTAAFQRGALDLSLRSDAPLAGWAGMPEVVVAERMRTHGASEQQVRALLTFAAAMDRARDADALWFAAQRLFEAEPWSFDPAQVAARSLTELADVLRRSRVSQRHGPDAAAWRLIAESLNDPDAAPAIARAVSDGQGDARELLDALQARSPGGTDRFPFLRGPKVGPMWVRMIAHPGGGQVTSLEVLPVAVDVQVRKVTEYLGVTDTGDLDLDAARPTIQAAWAQDVTASGAEGPGQLAGTAAALDPALWFWAKWGCTRCERSNRQLPIAAACTHCRFPAKA